ASPTTAGQQPGASSSAQPLVDRLGSVFESSFKRDFATIFDRGNAGEFDDPELRKAEEAALARFDQYAQVVAAAAPTTTTPTSTAPAVHSGPMANAAPGRGGPGAGPPDVTGGGGSGASAAPDPQVTAPIAGLATGEATAAARDVFGVRVRQSEARLTNMSQSLKADYPKAAQLASASTGTWDPTTFVPRTPQEAEAFAQRMVIDSTEAAARLEIVATQLDEARFEASLGSDPAATARVAKLEQELQRQEQYFGKLAAIVDRASGLFTEAGDAALSGTSLRGAGDLTANEYADRLRAAGVDEASIIRAVGAAEVGIEQVETPGGSPRLKQLATVLSSWALDYMNTHLEKVRDAGRDAKAERAEERDKLEARQHAVREQHQQEQAQQAVESQQLRAERQDAEFARFLEGLRQQAEGRLDAG
ncbi:MAG: hypothetical protein JWM90_852, partial [Thermoleophilia bacterium]|nr:hypothetical protein [Thermoleophilia bacterium]